MKRMAYKQTLHLGKDWHIHDIVAIKGGSEYLLATYKGVVLTDKDKVKQRYFEDLKINTLCLIQNSTYLVGGRDTLFVWDRHDDKRLFYISTEYICSLYHLENTRSFLIKTDSHIKLLTLKGDKGKDYHEIFEAHEKWNMTQSMNVAVNTDEISIATTQNIGRGTIKKRSIHVIKIPLNVED